MTIQEALHRAVGALGTAGVSDALPDAELLLRHVLGWDRAALLTRGDDVLPSASEQRLFRLVARRAERVPLQHLIGSVEFWRRRFHVSPEALIPRPETELALEAALQILAGHRSPLVVDVGTGSGCIALSLAAERSDARVHATELSQGALALARRNASELGLEARVRFHQGDLLEPMRGRAGEIDLVVSNPPYVDQSEIDGLLPEVKDHEPRAALVPPDGDRYSIYRRLLPRAAELLAPAGALVLEIGSGMDVEVASLCEASGLHVERIAHDLQGIPRTVVARTGSIPWHGTEPS